MSADRLELAVVAFDDAAAARAAGQPEPAMTWAQRALELFTAECPDDDPDVVNTLTLVAKIAGDLGRFEQAREAARTAYERSRDWPPGSGREVAEIALDAAVTYGDQERIAGAYRAAEQVLSTARAGAEAELGPEDPVLVSVLNGLGMLYKYMARFGEARSHYQRAVRLVEEAPVPSPEWLAALCHNLGGLAHAEGRPDDGIAWAERGLEIRAELDGDQEVATAADLGALGALYAQADRLAEAERALREAVERFARRLGGDHYEVGVALGNLGHVLARSGDAGAEELLRRALRIKAGALGARHPDLAVTLANLGALLSDAGDPEGARLLGEAEQIAADSFGADDARLLRIRELVRDATQSG